MDLQIVSLDSDLVSQNRLYKPLLHNLKGAHGVMAEL
jgi:hypothetical protein